MKIKTNLWVLLAVLLPAFSGCATNLSKPSSVPVASTVRLSEFDSVEMKAVDINTAFAEHGANQKAMRKIDELLFRDMGMLFPNLKRIESGKDFSPNAGRTLQITPYIKEIKFIGGGARFWAGAMAGSSAVLMETAFVDASTGKEIAKPEFYRSAGAYAGGWTVGGTDNRMLEDIAKDIVNYASLNK